MKQSNRWERGVNWLILAWVALLHVGALLAPFYFSFKGLALAFVLYVLTGLGITVGYHRYFTHRAFKTYRPIRWFLALLGGLAGEGPVIHWVAIHRKHHAHSDQEGDPHSPAHGPWWAHLLWFLPWAPSDEIQQLHRRWCNDLVKERFMRFVSNTYMLWNIALGLVLLGGGWLIWDFRTGISLLLWGMAFRIVFLLHATWAVNSAAHLWGSTPYKTTDNSRNNWLVAIFTFGEGWHNNHHAFPSAANYGHRWWQVDPGWWAIWIMEKLGLIWQVRRTES